MGYINTVLGRIPAEELGITLPHEHICCYSEYAYMMAGKDYLDKDSLVSVSSAYLKELKGKYGLNTFIDCTPINIGRDIELLKRVADRSEVNILCSTGFYYTVESVLYNSSAQRLCEYMVTDARNINAAIIKCAVENETISDFHEKLLRATAQANLQTGLPIVMHTNARNKNGIRALEIVLSEGVDPKAVTVGHLSDTNDMEYVKSIASYGCYIGLDRIVDNSPQYALEKEQSILELCKAGYEDQILLAHDAQFFNGFNAEYKIIERPRLSYIFDCILPRLPKQLADKIMVQNPMNMIICK